MGDSARQQETTRNHCYVLVILQRVFQRGEGVEIHPPNKPTNNQTNNNTRTPPHTGTQTPTGPGRAGAGAAGNGWRPSARNTAAGCTPGISRQTDRSVRKSGGSIRSSVHSTRRNQEGGRRYTGAKPVRCVHRCFRGTRLFPARAVRWW